MSRRTKIVATIGPASNSPEKLAELFEAGVNMTRVNCAHGKIEDHANLIKTIRETAKKNGKNIAVLTDLPGPKIRTTTMPSGFLLEDGAVFEVRTGTDGCSSGKIFTDYPTLTQDVKVGDSILLGDGGVDLEVTEVLSDHIKVRVVSGGTLQGRPGLHLPADRVTLPVPTDEDRKLIAELSIPSDVDFVAVSFVRTAEEIYTVKRLLGDSGIRVIAKIETPSAIDNIDEIVQASDAVMVARGDLGTECPFEDVPIYQKRIIHTALTYATPVITATQMMESMIENATPTRAEASDVANAVCDGTDAIMLSGETAVGHDPALVVRSMARIAEAAEIVADFDGIGRRIGRERHLHEITAAITHGAWYAMEDARVKAVLCCTRSGATAHVMAGLRPDATLVALCENEKVRRQEALTWGVHALSVPPTDDSDAMVTEAIAAAKGAGLVDAGDVVAVLSGQKNQVGATNSLRLIVVD